MNVKSGVPVSSTTAIKVPVAFALPAVETILKEFGKTPGSASLALNLQELHAPFEAMISVPVNTRFEAGNGRNQWHVAINAAATPQLYPSFEGYLTLLDAPAIGAELRLEGQYVVPFGRAGRVIDMTLLRGIAESSLRRFLRDVASRVAALSRWAAFT
jgi:hypothetical protein